MSSSWLSRTGLKTHPLEPLPSLFPSFSLPSSFSNPIMEALISNPLFPNPTLRRSTAFPLKLHSNSIHNRRRTAVLSAIDGASSLAADSTQVEITWQIFVGAIAGVTPFVVAGIEFSKRTIAQKRCKECGGSGLVLRDDDYFRCPECGGFLPWQSWRRFFWG